MRETRLRDGVTVPDAEDITAVSVFVKTLMDLEPDNDVLMDVVKQAGWVFRLYCDQFRRPEES